MGATTKSVTGRAGQKDATPSDKEATRSDKEPKARRPKARGGAARLLVVSLVVLSAVYAALLFALRPPAPGTALRFDMLNRYAVCATPQQGADPALADYCAGVDKRVETARLLDEDARVVGTLVPKGGAPGPAQRFWAAYPKSDAATNDVIRNLNAANAKVTIDPQANKRLVRFLAQYLLPLVVLANLFGLVFLLVQKGGSGVSDLISFGRIRARRRASPGSEAATTFADVAANHEAVIELAEVRDYLADPSSFAEMGALPPKGVLLVGPPGCGKTLLARAVAGEASAGFLSVSGSQFVEALVGVGAARVRDLFEQARASAPTIIFIDELDAVGRKRGAGIGQGHDEREQTLNELLVQMDGFSPTLGLVVIGATNRPDILDPALLRAGRFERHVTVERPDLEGREEILGLHARGRRLADPEAHIPAIARHSAGFSGADLAAVVNEAALLAVRERAKTISLRHLEEAVDRVLAGPKRKSRILSEEEKHAIACHEGGHAVVAAALGKAGGLQKLSIIARGRGVGHLAVLTEDKAVFRRSDVETQIAIAVGGFAAEELVFGEPSTGAEADLERATTTARDMVGRYGMSPRLGLMRLLAQDREVFLGRDYLAARDVAQPTLQNLDEEVRRILEEQRRVADAILSANRSVLESLTTALVAEETLEAEPLARALADVAPYARPAAGNGGAPTRRTRSRPAPARKADGDGDVG